MLNIIEEEIAPWGTPASIGAKFDILEPTFVEKKRLSRYDLKNKNKMEEESFLTYMRQTERQTLSIN